eukprot:356861-Chlamydomonas_euryale.AAC.7
MAGEGRTIKQPRLICTGAAQQRCPGQCVCHLWPCQAGVAARAASPTRQSGTTSCSLGAGLSHQGDSLRTAQIPGPPFVAR